MMLMQIVRYLAKSKDYETVNTAFARILAAKPHSADVERLISASNCLKTADRSRITVDTENLYLFIHYNLPPLVLWDPTPSVIHWLNQRERRVRQRPKGKQQQYFRGVFPEASLTAGERGDPYSDEEESPEKKVKRPTKAKRL